MKKVRLYELMTSNYMHNQYMYGAYKHYEGRDSEFFVLKGVMLKEYAETMALDYSCLKIKYYESKFFLVIRLLLDIIKNEHKIVITGCSTYWILILSLISRSNSLDIHLHGQFFGSKNSKFKHKIWKFMSKRVSLKLACPYYSGDVKVQILRHIHELPAVAQSQVKDFNRKKKNIIGILSGTGRAKWKGFEKLKDLEELGYKVVYYEPAIDISDEWLNYRNFMREVDYLFLNPVNDYFLYSPSGVITDSKNYEKPMIAFDDNPFIQRLIHSGCNNFKLISSVKD